MKSGLPYVLLAVVLFASQLSAQQNACPIDFQKAQWRPAKRHTYPAPIQSGYVDLKFKNVSKLEIRSISLQLSSRAMVTGPTGSKAEDTSKTVSVQGPIEPGKSKRARVDAGLSGSDTAIRLGSVTFGNGSVWTNTAQGQCEIQAHSRRSIGIGTPVAQ